MNYDMTYTYSSIYYFHCTGTGTHLLTYSSKQDQFRRSCILSVITIGIWQ